MPASTNAAQSLMSSQILLAEANRCTTLSRTTEKYASGGSPRYVGYGYGSDFQTLMMASRIGLISRNSDGKTTNNSLSVRSIEESTWTSIADLRSSNLTDPG